MQPLYTAKPQPSPWTWLPSPLAPGVTHPRHYASYTPKMEPVYYFESDTEMGFLAIELPGVKKDDVVIEIMDHALCVSAKRYRRSRLCVSPEGSMENDVAPTAALLYSLELRLGVEVRVEDIAVDGFARGVLSIQIPMNERRAVRRIDIGNLEKA